jgi:alkyldihydroxyacetonephosphate synthase
MTDPVSSGPRSQAAPGTMKWYGWGAEGETFEPADRPYLWPYAQSHLDISHDQPRRPPVPLAEIKLPPAKHNAAFQQALAGILPPERVSRHDHDRLIHAYGKSTRDLWRIRHGIVGFAPDCVVFPTSEDEVCRIVEAADRDGVVIIPFGGGSNVAGCVELHRPEQRMVVTVNMRLMARVLEVDKLSRTARVQSGLLGPALEAALNAENLTLGHFPDSFIYSTVGGWVATRSSGMLSDGYGNIEDMVLSLRMATPTGMVTTRQVPRTSNGPDMKGLCIGSEGTLGIITELTMCVRDMPAEREFRGYLFPDFASGTAAIRECQRAGCVPELSRLNDPHKTQLSSAFRRRSNVLTTAISKLAKVYLTRIKGIDLASSCLMIAAFDGTPSEIRRRRALVERIYRSHGSCGIGRGPGQSFAEAKFDFPHVRDFLMDYDVVCDVAETSTTWAQIGKLYENVSSAVGAALRKDAHSYWLGCHLSHSYHAGAALYFTFGFRCKRQADGEIDEAAEFAHYLGVKRAALDSFQANGATLSHHHAVGHEHLPWLPGEALLARGTVIDAIKPKVDPHSIMNPGKLQSGYTIANWETVSGSTADR